MNIRYLILGFSTVCALTFWGLRNLSETSRATKSQPKSKVVANQIQTLNEASIKVKSIGHHTGALPELKTTVEKLNAEIDQQVENYEQLKEELKQLNFPKSLQEESTSENDRKRISEIIALSADLQIRISKLNIQKIDLETTDETELK